MTVSFVAEDGSRREFSESVDTNAFAGDAEERISNTFLADFKATLQVGAVRKHHATAWAWFDLPHREFEIQNFISLQNLRAMWRELARTVLHAESNLALALSYKALEPDAEPDIETETLAYERLYHIHNRKMELLNEAVNSLITVQELVNRLLHEGLDGGLVDTARNDWERVELTRTKVLAQLDNAAKAGTITRAELTAIKDALKLPRETPRNELVRTYRNRLAHHNRPSVDYPRLFSALESRAGETITRPDGTVVVMWRMRAFPPAEYRFHDLHGAFSEQLDATVEMLQRLAKIGFIG